MHSDYNRCKVDQDQISYRDVSPQTNPSLDRMDQKGMSGLPYQVEFINLVIQNYSWKRSEDLEKTELKREVLRFLISKTLETLSIIKIVSTRMIIFSDVVAEGKF